MLVSVQRSVLGILVASTIALLALCVGVAGAAVSKLAADGVFRAGGVSGVAIDQASGDVLATGLVGREGENLYVGESEKFDSSGKVLSPPSPFAGGLHYGAALNPTNGHLYVASAFGEIEIYDSSTGELLSSFSVPPFFASFSFQEIFGNEVQIATDAAGNLFVPNMPENKVLEYNEAGTLLDTFTGSGAHALKQPRGAAVDASGDVWVADYGNNRIEELSPTGAFMTEFESEGVKALALDGHGDVLAIVDNATDDCGAVTSPCEHLVEYSESGTQLADVGAGSFGSPNDEAGGTRIKESMVAVDQASGRVYVTDGLKKDVWIYRPPEVPSLGQESVAEVGTSEAKLGALVQPGGIQTNYRFEYDTREYKEGEGPHGASVPYPEGSAGEGFYSRVAWASAKNLAPGTTYHYRAVVTNALGSVSGPDQTFTTETVAQAECPNEAARSGFSGDLPECRAYELVTPPGKSSAQPDVWTEAIGNEQEQNQYRGGVGGNMAASDGSRFAYQATEIMPGSQTPGLEFIAKRGPAGWTSEDALPRRPYTGNRCPFGTASQTEVLQYSTDLSKAIVVDNSTTTGLYSWEFSEDCRSETVEVVSGEPFEQNLLARDNEDGTYRLVNLTPAGVAPEPAILVAASADMKVIVFSERAKLTSDASSGTNNMYEWHDGALHLLRLVSPSGTPLAGTVVGLSAEGSDILFTANKKLYVRVNGERTNQVDEAQGGSGPGGGGKLAQVSDDGSQVLFTDDASAGLTSDTVAGSGANLYRYDVNAGQLSDLTPVSEADAAFKRASKDGSYVYFASNGVQSGAQTNQLGETAQSGQPNLYVDHAGKVTFVIGATLLGSENSRPIDATSANGEFFAFTSAHNLTGYDNNGKYEVYLYSAAANRFECASCNPDGEEPSSLGSGLGSVPRAVSDNGQVFFEADEALLPRDTNGDWDAYEFNFNGGLHLISTGSGSGPSVLLDASVSGNDVFFLTPQSLVAQDSFQEARKIYDARVDGGFPEAASPPACTTADACRVAASPQPAIYGAPSSQTFSGVGNLTPSEVKPKSKPKAKATGSRCKRLRNKRKRRACEARNRKRAKKNNRKAKSHRGGK